MTDLQLVRQGVGMITHEWAHAITSWATWARAMGAPPTTLGTRTQHLEHLARRIGVADPWVVTGEQLVMFMAAQTWAVETRRSRRTTLRVFYAWAVEHDHLAKSPAVMLPRVRPSTPNPRPAPDSVYKPTLLVADDRERLMLRLAAEHGMRRAEISVVHTRRDVVEDLTGWSLVVHGKGGRQREVPLLDDVAALLRGLPDGYAFPGSIEGHLSPRWVGKLVNRLLPGEWTIHKLRHRAATAWWQASDGDMLQVMTLLGHASPVTTRAYVKVDDSRLRQTIERAAAA